MKYFINLFLIIALPFSCYAQLPTSGLVAWYPFCGNTQDYSGHSYHLHDSGAILTTDRFGNANCAYHFNGVNNEMFRTPPLPTDTSNFTYACWVLLDTTGNMEIIGNGNLNLDGYEMLVTGPTLLSPGGDLAVIFGNVNQYYPTPVTLHVWHHIILRRRATHLFDFIIDTTLIGTWTATFNNTSTYEKFTMGMDYTNGTNPFHGKMDDAAIYNRALSDSEIIKLYHYNPDVNVVTLGSDTTLCSGAIVLTSPAEPSGTSYLWNTASTDTFISVSVAGTYWLSIINTWGCKSSDTINVLGGAIAVNIGPDTTICSGSSILLSSPTTPSGSSYIWSTGGTTTAISVSSTGTYWLHVTNGACSASDTMHLAVTTGPIVNLGPDTAICPGSSITLSSPGTPASFSFLWSTGATTPTINVTSPGSYWLTTSGGICFGTDTIHIATAPLPIANLGPDTAICPGSSLVLSSPGTPMGSSFSWSTGASSYSISITAPGTYWLTVTAICSNTDTIHIAFAPTPVVNLGHDTAVCAGYSILLQSLYSYSGASYTWNTGAHTPSITAGAPGAYWLSVTDGACTGRDTVDIRAISFPTIDLGNEVVLCNGNSMLITSHQPVGSTYSWSTGNTGDSILVSVAGTYWLTVTDSNCASTDTIHVIAATTLVDLGPDPVVCTGDMVHLHSSISYFAPVYNWSTGQSTPSIDVLSAGTYWLAVTQNGCTGRDTVNVSLKPGTIFGFGTDTAICAGVTIVLSASAPGAYLWSTGSTDSFITVSRGGAYSLTITDSGCSTTATIQVTEINQPVVYFRGDTTLCTGETLLLPEATSDYTFLWSDGSYGKSFVVTEPGTYWATASLLCGSVSDTIRVAYAPCDIWVPTAFTPNGDGKNDFFRPVGDLSRFKGYSLNVYNRWGQRVFYSDDIYTGWDGSFQGVIQDLGTYYYLIYYSVNEKQKMLKGDFELIR